MNNQDTAQSSNVEAERAILGAILLSDGKLYPEVAAKLMEADFSLASHRVIFALMGRMKGPIDLVTLCEELQRRNALQSIGGPAYISSLTDGLPKLPNVDHYVAIVKQRAAMRSLARTGEWIGDKVRAGEESAEDLAAQAQRKLAEMETGNSGGFVSLADAYREGFPTVDAIHQKWETVKGIPTGFRRLDQMTGGLHDGELTLLAARPSLGKTSLAVNIACHVAAHEKAVGIFSLEMSREAIVLRIICAEARVDSSRLMSGALGREDRVRLVEAAAQVTPWPLWIDDEIQRPETMFARAKALQARHGLHLVVVDYLQLMSTGKHENRVQEISYISRMMKQMAKELRVPVLALSQLNRDPEERGGCPKLSDLRECVVGETLVCMADGQRIPISELVGSKPRLASINASGKLLPTVESDAVWQVGPRQVFRTILASGRSIVSTAQHRLLCFDGWKRVEELKAGDRIATARHLPEPQDTETWPSAHLILLGHMVGDGSYLSHQPMRYATASEENSQAVSGAAVAFGCITKRHQIPGKSWHQLVISGNGNRWHPKGVGAWLRDLGIFGQRSHEKHLPACIFRLSNSQLALFLRHLWATDGTICAVSKSPHISYNTNSERLAMDVAALLLRFGIVARIGKSQKRNYRVGYYVRIVDSDGQHKFLDRIGAFGPKREDAERMRVSLAGRQSNTNVDTLPMAAWGLVRHAMKNRGISQRGMAAMRGTSYCGTGHFKFSPSRVVALSYARLLRDAALSAAATADLFWDRIKEIVPCGERQVYDLTVPSTSRWLADGIVNHNSGQLEQDADVVLFLWREKAAAKHPSRGSDEAAEDRMVNLTIGKQRNGPIGNIKLAFLKQFCRFENAAKFGDEQGQFQATDGDLPSSCWDDERTAPAAGLTKEA